MKAARIAVAFWASMMMIGCPALGSAAEQPLAKSRFASVAAEAEKQVGKGLGGTESTALKMSDLQDYADYLKWQRGFARDAWSWHLFSTKLLMYVVLAIVLFGLLLTYMQFTRDLRRRPRRPKALSAGQPASSPDDQPSTLKLGPTGVEITSQVIGLLVMGFSLAFFYLYVKVVYPMQEVELQRHAQAAADTTPEKRSEDKPR